MDITSGAVEFNYKDSAFKFYGVSDDDYIYNYLKDKEEFYEQDVLERINIVLQNHNKTGAAIDAGAFMGTHSIYFSSISKLKPILAFEANPKTYLALITNIDSNNQKENITPINNALGSKEGFATIRLDDIGNRGTATISTVSHPTSESIRVTTLSQEAADRAIGPVALIKIDVEGFELQVLEGGIDLINKNRPVLCIEIHTTKQLKQALSLLKHSNYVVTDCLGFSPTYIMEPALQRNILVKSTNILWVLYSMLPSGYRTFRWYIKKLSYLLSMRVLPPQNSISNDSISSGS